MIYIKTNLLDNKVAIIDSEGAIHAMGRVNEPRVHIKYLLDYIDKQYPNIDMERLNIGYPRKLYGYIFGKLGNIIYFNDGHTGMIYFPDELTLAQMNTMKSLDLGNQKIAICFNPKKIGNKINFRMVGLEGDYDLKDSMKAYERCTQVKRTHFKGR